MIRSNDNEQDFEVLFRIAKALWHEHGESQRQAADAIGAASLSGAPTSDQIERAVSGLVKKVTQQGLSSNLASNHQAIRDPFFRLEPKERLVLIALKDHQWSYAKLARILDIASDQLEGFAWSARIRFGSFHSIEYPLGAPVKTPQCPTYHVRRPWTQRFLDEEFASGSERLFIQNHLLACGSCRLALNRCRKFYFEMTSKIPEFLYAREMAGWFRHVMQQGEVLRLRGGAKSVPSPRHFMKRTDVRIAVLALGIIVIRLISH